MTPTEQSFYEKKAAALAERVAWLEDYSNTLELALDRAYDTNRVLMGDLHQLNLRARSK